MALAYFVFMVCFEVTFLTMGLYWLLQRILKSSSMVKYLHGPGNYTPPELPLFPARELPSELPLFPQELPSLLYSNASPCPSLETQTHIPSLTMLSHLPPPPNVHEYSSSPAAALRRGGAVYPIRPLHHPMDHHGPAKLGTDTRRGYIPLCSQDIYYGCPIPGIYSPHLSMANHAWQENSFGGSLGGPVPSLDGSSARFRERPGHSGYPNLYEHRFEGPFGGPAPSLDELTARLGERPSSARYGYPTCGGGLTPSATPSFEQPPDDNVEANEKSNTNGNRRKACGCACRARGLGKDAPDAPANSPLAAEVKSDDSIPLKIFGAVINMQRCPTPPEENFECGSKGVDKDAPPDNLLATDENNRGSFPDHISVEAMLPEMFSPDGCHAD